MKIKLVCKNCDKEIERDDIDVKMPTPILKKFIRSLSLEDELEIFINDKKV